MSVAFNQIARCLELSDPTEKCRHVERLARQVEESGLGAPPVGPSPEELTPGRPQRPVLVEPHKVPRRRLGSEAGRAALLHAIAHIEFNAINLALDAAWRFRDMPSGYYEDWVSVAADEARHFQMLEQRLRDMGHCYGDFPAHNGLWEMAMNTTDSCLARMALVPRVLEARGLDVTPGMMERLRAAGDGDSVQVLEVILEEEVRHVDIGTRWFGFCCAQAGLDPDETFLRLLRERFSGQIKGPLNLTARRQAGFTERELEHLSGT